MSDFDLDAAVSAARRVADDATASDAGLATRLRIRETLAQRRRARARRTPILAGVLATIFGSTAFAYYAEWQPPWRDEAPRVDTPPPPPIAHREEPAFQRPGRHAVAHEAARLTVDASSPASARPPASAKPLAPAAAPTPAAPAAAEPVPSGTRDPELAAYAVAHAAHFRGGSPGEALRAWDAYLAAYPHGKLALEARFSRALILIKLERFADAAAALRPFAEAPEGAYRRAEARRLLDALPAVGQ